MTLKSDHPRAISTLRREGEIAPCDALDLQTQQQIFLSALSQTGTALFVIDALRKLKFASEHAQVLLETRDAFMITSGKLATVDARSTAELMNYTAALMRVPAFGTDTIRWLSVARRNRASLNSLLIPFREATGSSCVLLICRISVEPMAVRESLSNQFRLTLAEARIAQLLTTGLSIAQIAARQHCHTQTVRKQLRSVFAKTDTHRQAELVALVMRTTSLLGSDR